ncbi:MAG: hypothetical protein C4581_03635 [Nitrospiraceae bacterium]|nr:MAG: hypothetical protein C4581_03635 [Nitrospiraceae bacterium]
MKFPPTEYIFAAIALILFTIAARDYFKAGNTISIACKIRLRLAVIFIIVAIGLFILHNFIGK